MRTDRIRHLSVALFARVFSLSVVFCGAGAMAAEAPPPPLPPDAEAAYQDLRSESGERHSSAEKNLDEAVFTEISPLTIPETGIALPADQEH